MTSIRQLRPDPFTADNFAVLAIDWVPLDHAADPPVMIGDLVSAGIDDLPVYRVMGLDEGRAWVATHPGAPQRMMSLAEMRWRGVERPAGPPPLNPSALPGGVSTPAASKAG